MFLNLKICAPGPFIDNDSGLVNVPGGAAFLYLFRRYGQPKLRSRKTIAGYQIETGMTGLHLALSINHKTCWVFVVADREIEERYIAEFDASVEAVRAGGCEYSQFCQAVHTAVSDCLTDQLRPVAVAGVHINILGDDSARVNTLGGR